MTNNTTPASQTVSYDATPAIVLAGKAKALVTQADAYVIDSPEMLELAAEDLRQVKGLQKEVEAKRTAIVGPLNQAVKAINELFRAPTDYLGQAESTLKFAINAYQVEQERKAAEQRRLAEEAQRAEQERLAAEQAEAQRQADELRQQAEQAAAEGDIEQAQQLAQKFQAAQHQATTVESLANVTSVAMPTAAAPKVSGIAGRVTYSSQVDNLMDLVKAVALGQVPIEALQADKKFLDTQARAYKKAGPLYPGVTIVATRGISARAA